MGQPAWQRLTRTEATNYLLTALIVLGADLKGQLVIDGDPGNVLEGVLTAFDKDTILSTMESTRAGNPFPAINMFRAITKIGKDLGYFGNTLKGLVEYLRSLSAECTIST